MEQRCPYHIDHERRIENLEQECKTMKEKIGSPAVTVAIISLIGVLFSATSAFAAVIAAPVLRAWLGV